eukprot:TRINITY_DN22027_c0_g2_i1.p1 TRINITY_DN22027_c0_g2~~TRINITY_DN22027_c0_g2_i1.p1  ORF type:complete len:505 (+),score=48.63 TRINITY_DN22027_c0_g2_i1:84-1517(+)
MAGTQEQSISGASQAEPASRSPLVPTLETSETSGACEHGLLGLQAFLAEDTAIQRIEDAARRRRRGIGSRPAAASASAASASGSSVTASVPASVPAMPVLPSALHVPPKSFEIMKDATTREWDADVGEYAESVARAPRAAATNAARVSSSSTKGGGDDSGGQKVVGDIQQVAVADLPAGGRMQGCVKDTLPPLHISSMVMNDTVQQVELIDCVQKQRPMRLGLPRSGDTPHASARDPTKLGADAAKPDSSRVTNHPVLSQRSSEGRQIRFIDVPSEQVESFQQFARDLANKAQLECALSNPYVQALEAHRADLKNSSFDPYGETSTSCSLASRLATEREDGLASLTSLKESPSDETDIAIDQSFPFAWPGMCQPESSGLDPSNFVADDAFSSPSYGDAVVVVDSREPVQSAHRKMDDQGAGEDAESVPEWAPKKGGRGGVAKAAGRSKDASAVVRDASPKSEVGWFGKALQGVFWSD